MTTIRLLAALSGAAVTTGVLLIVAGLRPGPPRREAVRPGTWPTRLITRLRRLGTDPARVAGGWALWRWPTALLCGLGVLLVSGWPVAGGLAAVTVVGLPVILATGHSAEQAIAKPEAVEEWSRRLADVLVAGVGLEQAVAATARTSPVPIAPAVDGLVGRLGARWPVETALRAFADDLDDAAGDLIAATLILGSRRRGPGLAKVLTAVADSLAEEVATRRKVEAERAKPRTTARAVTLITLAVITVGALNGSYLRPYGTPLGQFVLAMLAATYLAALWWMHSIARGSPAPRILAPAPGRPPPPDQEAL